MKELWRRLSWQWRKKLFLQILLTTVFCVPYFLLQRFPLFPVSKLPLTVLDRWIGFDARWIWAYQSVYLLIPIPPWLAVSDLDLKKYLAGYMLLCAAGFTLWTLFPILSPRPELVGNYPMYKLLRSYDGSLNSIPSLHAALAWFSFLFARDLLIQCGDSLKTQLLICVTGLWALLITVATVALKQHYLIDLVPAFILTAVSYRAANTIVTSRNGVRN